MMCDSTERTVPMKICRVCGDRAIGFNFNVLTCGSCKLFFRRNALQHEVLNFCQFANNCIVSKSTRKSCPSCRLAKCFKVEMKKEFISKRHNSLSIIQINKNSTDLKGHEIVQLSQLNTAGSAYCEENSFREKGEAANLLQVANLDGYSVVRTIKFCKSLPGFKELQVNDQLILLKHFCAEKGFIRGAFYCDLKKDGFPLTDDKSKNKAVFVKFNLVHEFDFPNAYKIVRNFARFLQREMKNDSTVRDLILAQLLFQHREHLACPETVRYQHVLYSYLLKRYLEQKHGTFEQAKSKYCALMGILKQIDKVRSVMTAAMTHYCTKGMNSRECSI